VRAGALVVGGIGANRGSQCERRIRREPTREDEEAGVGDHAMLRPKAALAHVPEARQRFERFDRREPPVPAQRVDEALHLQRGRHESGEHAARTERRGDRVEEPPGLGEIDDDAVDVALRDPGERVGDAEPPVRRRAVEARDVLRRARGEVLAQLVRDQLARRSDRA
jgi:hypothetical protein